MKLNRKLLRKMILQEASRIFKKTDPAEEEIWVDKWVEDDPEAPAGYHSPDIELYGDSYVDPEDVPYEFGEEEIAEPGYDPGLLGDPELADPDHEYTSEDDIWRAWADRDAKVAAERPRRWRTRHTPRDLKDTMHPLYVQGERPRSHSVDEMKLTRRQLRDIILNEMSSRIQVGDESVDLDSSWESGEYKPYTPADTAELKPPAAGWESHYGNLARLALGLNGKKYEAYEEIDGNHFNKFWVDRIKEKEKQYGDIVSWSGDTNTINFRNKDGTYTWLVNEDIYHVMNDLNINTALFPLIDSKVQQLGPITDYSFEDFTITFRDSRRPMRIPQPKQPDYEGRN